MPPRLVRSAAHPAPPPLRILQFGEGNFLRAFADHMIDAANRQGLGLGGVLLVQPRGHLPGHGATPAVAEQGGLYHVAIQGLEGGAPVDRAELVACVGGCLNPRREWAAILAAARDPGLAVVISNTTEAGIVYAPEPAPPSDACPASFPAKLAALLHARWTACGGDPARGLLVLPTELIADNGRTLRAHVLRHGADWGLPSPCLDWIAGACVFADTLVDQIVSGFPAESAPAWFERLGAEDRALVVAEPYRLWAIAGAGAMAARLPLDRAGFNVVFTDDLAPFRTRKVRLLNGGHTALAAAAFLAGCDTVGAAVADPVVGRFLRRAVLEEILPGVPGPREELRAYAEAVLERFANPFLRHQLLSISLNAVAKWTVRVLPSIADAVADGRATPCLAHSLAALIAFHRGSPTASPGELTGERDGRPYPVRDDPAALALLAAAWQAHAGDPAALAAQVCGDARLWGRDLRPLGLAPLVAQGLDRILAHGSRGALERLL